MQSDLIYDVGMHDGDDTAFYLCKGYRVVAIEADPFWIAHARKRFRKEIDEKRLTVLHLGIGPHPGKQRFWVCESKRLFSSFMPPPHGRLRHKYRCIDVSCRPFGEILDEQGVPFYLKIDIEGYDHYCIKGLNGRGLPEYVSSELSHFDNLLGLRNLGYEGFKIIMQVDQCQFVYDQLNFKMRTRVFVREIPWLDGLVTKLLPRMRGGRRRVRQRCGECAFGPSGPFGEETDGEWQTWEEVKSTWHRCIGVRDGLSMPRGFWLDVHAKRFLSPSPGEGNREGPVS